MYEVLSVPELLQLNVYPLQLRDLLLQVFDEPLCPGLHCLLLLLHLLDKLCLAPHNRTHQGSEGLDTILDVPAGVDLVEDRLCSACVNDLCDCCTAVFEKTHLAELN